jgi:hypothetical protein
MFPSIRSDLAGAARRGSAGIAVALLVAGLGGCSIISKVNNIRHVVEGNKSTIDHFTAGLKNTKATPFQVTYITTGNSPTTVTYAVQPPDNIAFLETASGGSGAAEVNLIGNSSGEYSCSQASTGSQWSCEKLGKASAATQNALFTIYTPSHWVTFLTAFSIAAGVAGDKVTTSTMSVNGFSLNCVDFNAKGIPGESTICTTAQNILGYVKVAGQPTSFQIKSYTSSPPASAFQLPPGATVTNAPSS